MPLLISKRLTLRHFFSPFVQCTSAAITVGQRTQSDRTADAIRLDSERNPIGRRTVDGGIIVHFAPAKYTYYII